MGRNRSIKTSLGQVARLWLLSASLIILILFNMSQADVQQSSSAISTGGGDQYPDATYRMPANSSEAFNDIDNSVQPRIHGGYFARPGEFPFHVGIYSGENYTCGGVLIDNDRILTSRSCSQFPLMRVKLGDLNKANQDGERTMRVVRTVPHPTFNLAILYTDPIPLDQEPIPGLGLVYPLTLPRGPQNVRGNLMVTGWGSETFGGPLSDHLKKSIVTVTDCHPPRSGFFCSQQGRGGPCTGDAGGPIFKQIKGAGFILMGIINGLSCPEQCNKPGCEIEYTNISRHLEWIKNNP